MMRLTVLVALFLAGCAATNPAVSQSKTPASASAMHAAASKAPACYKTTRSVDDGDFQNTVTDSDC
jgi:uncharacterized lipoprotein YmbA